MQVNTWILRVRVGSVWEFLHGIILWILWIIFVISYYKLFYICRHWTNLWILSLSAFKKFEIFLRFGKKLWLLNAFYFSFILFLFKIVISDRDVTHSSSRLPWHLTHPCSGVLLTSIHFFFLPFYCFLLPLIVLGFYVFMRIPFSFYVESIHHLFLLIFVKGTFTSR